MTKEECFSAWAPDGVVWSQWAKPVLFVHLDDASDSGLENEEAIGDAFGWVPEPRYDRALIVDLPGATSILVGLALARRGHRPVPLFNGNVHPLAVVDVGPIVRLLKGGAGMLGALCLRPDAPPAFLVDANRMSAGDRLKPGRFDNRWIVLPQDFPSATLLLSRGIREALVLSSADEAPPADLAHILLRWQKAGIKVMGMVGGYGGEARDMRVAPPSMFRRAWHRVIALAGLKRSNVGGFGGVIPEPSSHVGIG